MSSASQYPTPFSDALEDMMSPKVKMYVRLGEFNGNLDEGVRRVSFKIPTGTEGERINPLDLLDLGYAIDGNEAVMDVTGQVPTDYNSVEVATTLNQELGDVQRATVHFLKSKGYSVEFA